MNNFHRGLAVLAGAAYEAGVDAVNRIAFDGIARLLARTPPSATGFEAKAYLLGNQVVISYTGTGELRDWIANAFLGFGSAEFQLRQAVDFYQLVKRLPEAQGGANVVFTGHSLGGGLASLMGVFFNKRAVAFDPAPFRMAATKENANRLADFVRLTYGADSDIESFSSDEMPLVVAKPGLAGTFAAIAAGAIFAPVIGTPISRGLAAYLAQAKYPVSMRGELNVDAYAIAGEALTTGFFGLGSSALNDLKIMSSSGPNLLNVTGSGADLGATAGVKLHSQALLVAVASSPLLETVLTASPRILEHIFSPVLYSRKSEQSETDFLVKLVNHEFSSSQNGLGGSGHIQRFASDLLVLQGVSGLARSDQAIRDALTIAAMEYYYFKDAQSATALFTEVNGALRFKYSDIGADQYKSIPRLVEAVRSLLPAADKEYADFLSRRNAWSIQAGADPVNIVATGDSNAMIGGTGNDSMTGAGNIDNLFGMAGDDTLKGEAGFDILVGGEGNDTLNGGAGTDWMVGGTGTDTYMIAAGDGQDFIWDNDGLGSIQFRENLATNAIALTGGQLEAGSTDTWIQNLNADGTRRIIYRRSGADLVASLPGSAATNQSGSVRIKDYNFTSGSLGITLLGTSAPGQYADVFYDDRPNNPFGFSIDGLPDAAPWQALHGLAGGDQLNVQHDNVVAYGGDGNDLLQVMGNLPGGGAFRDYANIRLVGGLGNDYLQGGSGSDVMFGGDNDDWMLGQSTHDHLNPTPFDDGGDYLDGGAGNDFLTGGVGADVLKGGDGNDIILGGAMLHPILNGNSARDFFEGTQQWIVSTGELQFSLPGLSGFASFTLDQGNSIDGDAGSDILIGGVAADTINGGSGRDLLIGLAGDDRTEGGEGNDILSGDGTQGLFTLGGQSIHALVSEHGNDQLLGGAGNDELIGDGGSDDLWGGADNDILRGDALNLAGEHHRSDYLDGEDGNDELQGMGGGDSLFGGAGNDLLFGDHTSLAENFHGDDYLDGEDGDDVLLDEFGMHALLGQLSQGPIKPHGLANIRDGGMRIFKRAANESQYREAA